MQPRGILLLAILIGGSWLAPRSAGSMAIESRVDQHADIEALAEAESWQAIADQLEPYFDGGQETAWAHEFYGRALFKLGRLDEGAFHLDRAIDMLTEAGEDRGKDFRILRNELLEADPFANRRVGFFKKLKRYFAECAGRLIEDGHDDQALDVLERVEWLLTEASDAELIETLEALRTAKEDVDLDGAGDQERIDGDIPLVHYESKHYILDCNLEEEVTKAVGDTMDNIFESYVQIYLDGDASRVPMKKAGIRIHGSWDLMVKNWPGQEPTPGLGGWWSPGEGNVTCYDTRARTGSLDEMLGTLFHEASHQFMTVLSQRGGRSPAWLNEGTASFFEGARALQDGSVVWPDAATGRLRSLMYFLGNPGGPSPADVIGFDNPGSYAGEYYCFGWGLVYFLQEYEDPDTLAYVWRPYYQQYLQTITTKGGASRKLFEEVFLADGNPGGFKTFDDFVKAWTTWIREDVWPMHSGNQPRALRLARVEKYMEAADAAAVKRKAGVTEQDLLERALRDIEYVRTQIDTADLPDGDVVLREADIAQRLGRDGAEAWMIQLVLDISDEGFWDGLTDEAYTALADRLGKINKSYRSLSLIRNRTRSLRRDARVLLADYLEEGHFELRAYTFAARAGAALRDPELRAEADRLRGKAAETGTLSGSIEPLDGKDWTTIYSAEPDFFSHAKDSLELFVEFGPGGQVCGDIEVSGEYELRGELGRLGEIDRGTIHGVVVAGTESGDWTIVGINHRGTLSVLNCTAEAGGVTTTKVDIEDNLETPLEDDESPHFAVHVFPEGTLVITIDNQEPIEVELDYEMPRRSHPGIFTKTGRTKLSNFVIENYP